MPPIKIWRKLEKDVATDVMTLQYSMSVEGHSKHDDLEVKRFKITKYFIILSKIAEVRVIYSSSYSFKSSTIVYKIF